MNSDSVIGNYSFKYMSSNESISADVNATWNFYLNKKSGTSIKACLFNHFLYFVPNNIVMSSAQTCSVSSHTSDTCTAVAPSSASSMTGIISAYSDQSPINWHETISITKTCHYHMATWTALWLPVLLIICSVVCGAIESRRGN